MCTERTSKKADKPSKGIRRVLDGNVMTSEVLNSAEVATHSQMNENQVSSNNVQNFEHKFQGMSTTNDSTGKKTRSQHCTELTSQSNDTAKPSKTTFKNLNLPGWDS